MDQNSGNGTDKRNWRERLGVGTSKDMPRIADEFQPPKPPLQRANVKPAPMAPRPQGKAIPVAPRAAVLPRANAAPLSPEKLADKLKSQREAQERLAEQRVQAARQRVEIKPDGVVPNRPKFVFAEEDAEQAKPQAAPPVQRAVPPPPALPLPPKPVAPPVAAPRVASPAAAPVVTPPRTGLGVDRPPMPPRPAAPVPPVMPPRPQAYAPPPPPAYTPNRGYGAAVPPYRPIDPSASRTGYVPTSYPPPPAYQPPATGYPAAPRLTPASPPGFESGSLDDPRSRQLRPPQRQAGYREVPADQDMFEESRAPRRATATDYSQAYRDVEHGYDDEPPRSRGPFIMLAMLALAALVAGGLVWFYVNNIAKPAGTAAVGTQTNTPVVEAPAQPAKSTPEPVAQQPANQPSKKLIYDRIVGDREVLGGDVMQSEEVPQQPVVEGQDGATPVADPAAPAGDEELAPLPIPPPPGQAGSGDQQGALPSPETTQQATTLPAAGESQAAASSQGGATGKSDPETASSTVAAKSDSTTTASSLVEPVTDTAAAPPPVTPEAAPAPGELPGAQPPSETQPATGTEVIADPEPAPAKAVEEPVKVKKPVVKKAEKALGAKPVVLVPAAKKPRKPAATSAEVADALVVDGTRVADGTATGGLYESDTAVAGAQPAPEVATQPAPTKKRRTLADLFKNDETAAAEITTVDAPAQAAPAAPKQITVVEVPPVPKPAPAPVPAPAPETQVASGPTGYVVQLASFRSKEEASAEFGRLRSKHSLALSGLAPVVTTATVAGTTRYRLAAGTMQSKEQANAVCAKLFAAGERDCLVKRQ